MLKSPDPKTKQRTETIAFQPQPISTTAEDEKSTRPTSKTLIASSEEFNKIRKLFLVILFE